MPSRGRREGGRDHVTTDHCIGLGPSLLIPRISPYVLFVLAILRVHNEIGWLTKALSALLFV